MASIDSIMRSFESMPEEVILNGYCDSRGSNEYNEVLALKRARSVHQYLVAKNVDTGNIKITENSFGETQLLNKDETDNERSLNRRVEMVVIYPSKVIVDDKTERIEVQKNLTSTLTDSSTKAGTLVSLPNLLFIPGGAGLLASSEPTIKELLQTLKNNPTLVISIEGHICCITEDMAQPYQEQLEYPLSTARAKTVYTYLIENGIDAKRLSYKGWGSTHPIYPLPEKTENQRIANRRVEIRIISK